MFFRTSHKRYPNLCRYVEMAMARQNTNAAEVGAITMLALAGLCVPIAVVAMFVFESLLWSLITGLGGLLLFVSGWRTLAKAKADPDRLSLEAFAATSTLNESLKRNRVHRIAGEPTVTLLEECARHWARTRQALESPFWTSPNLPLHYQGIREQSARAADRAMDEVLVLLRPELNSQPQGQGVAGFVEDVLDTYVLQKPVETTSLPVAFGPVRHMAERMKELADNVEALTLEVAKDPTVQSEFRAEAALEMCIGELRSIRQAETELRQNLGG